MAFFKGSDQQSELSRPTSHAVVHSRPTFHTVVTVGLHSIPLAYSRLQGCTLSSKECLNGTISSNTAHQVLLQVSFAWLITRSQDIQADVADGDAYPYLCLHQLIQACRTQRRMLTTLKALKEARPSLCSRAAEENAHYSKSLERSLTLFMLKGQQKRMLYSWSVRQSHVVLPNWKQS